MKRPTISARPSFVLAVFVLAAVAGGCAAPRSTALKELEPIRLENEVSVTIACIRDVSKEAVTGGLFNPEKRAIDLSEAAQSTIGNLLQDCGALSNVKVVPHGEIPEDATELTCIALARKEKTDLVIHGKVNHRASFSLNWLTWWSYIPGIAVAAPLWAPNYTLKGEVELTLYCVDVNSLERVFSKTVTVEAYTSICFMTRLTALHDRYVELEKDIALHNAAVDAATLLLKSLIPYKPGKGTRELAAQDKVIAVIDFEPASDFIKRRSFGNTAAEMFTTAFDKSGVFKVMERQRIKDVLTERAFSMTDMVKDKKAREVARNLLGIDFLLVGSVAQVGARLEVTARLLDTSTGEVLLSESDGITRYEDLQILVELMARRVMERYSKLRPAPEK
jgi:TolB-like protein